MSQPASLVQGYGVVTAQTLEDRINMYISAVDKATAMNNGHQSSQLQQDIQKLVDLMERISAGQVVTEEEVPPPLAITPQTDVVANPLGELSSRLAEYHKALYFAEEELSEDRMNKIQRLQRGLQTIHELQKRTQAGFPVRADEIPPAVTIPSDDEFDLEAVSTLESRLAHYNDMLLFASESQSDKRKIPKIQSAIRTVEFLLTRAKAKRPVWKKDIPPEFEYTVLQPAQQKGQLVNKAKFTLQLRSLQKRVQNITFKQEDQQKHLDKLKNKLQELETKFPKMQTSAELENSLAALTKEIESVEAIAFAEKSKDLDRSKEDLDLIETRLTEYKAAVLASKRDGQVKDAIKHFKVLKGLQALKEALEKGEAVDMTLVPPPPRNFTPTSESLPSLADLNETTVSSEVSQNSSGATAHLSPVFIKPAVESAEDKLAKKLFSYLDKGTDSNLPVSKQMLNINNINTAPSQYFPKVQNTGAKSSDLVGSSGSSTADIDNIVSLGDKATEYKENYIEELQDERSLLEYEENSFQSLASQSIKHDQNIISQNVDENQDQKNKGKEKEEENKSSQINEVVASDKDAPNPPLPKSSDIYLRKTLDSVGFLSCQKVPDHSAQFNTVLKSSKPKLSDHSPPESVTVERQSSEVNIGPVNQQDSYVNCDDNIRSLNEDEKTHASLANGFSHVGLPSHDFDSLNQPDEAGIQCNAADTAGSQTSNVHSTPLPGRHPDSTAIFESAQNENNESNNAVPSYVMFPSHSVNMDTKKPAIGQSDYPDTLMPEVLTDVSDDRDLQHSLHSSSDNLIPDIVRSDPTSAAVVDISHSNSSAKSIGQHVASQGDDLEIGQTAVLNISKRDAPYSVDADAQQDNSNGKTSPDTLEFLDLMDSMAMPPAAEPISFPYFSSSTFPLPSTRQSEPVFSSQKPDVLLKENPSIAEVATHNSEDVDPSVQAFSQNNHSSQTMFMSSSTHLSDDQADKEKPDKPSTSNCIPESNHASQNQQSTPFPISSLPEDVGHSAPTLSNYKTSLGSRASGPTQNGLSENLSASTTSTVQLGHNSIHAGASYSQSRPMSTSATRSTNDFSYSDVAFTCLENLKYDCLLSLAKGTEESLQEEKKLKIKFELIKNKLRNGGKRTWEVYKACVERERASLIQQIEDLCLLQQWGEVQLLSERKNIAERELVILKSRVPELKY
ncbi:hypothetical protein BsWGS_02966 [Bradybaena similaris]